MALPDHSLSRRRRVDLLLIAAAVAALAACTTDVSSQEGSTEPNPNERSASPAADYSILRPGNRYAADVGDRYLDEIQPTLASRCAVCHSCTNGPCQLNMTSFAALQRGIHSKNPYKWGLTDNLQTRVSDNRPLSEWRAKGFKSVLPDGGDPESSIFWKALELGDQNTSSPDPNQGPLATSQIRRLAQDHDAGNYSCPSNSFEWWLFTWKYPQGGMPWGLPTDADAHATLEEWTLDGAPGPSAAAQRTVSSPQRTVMTQMDPDALVATWDAFLDGSDLRSKLVARYIFEHAYSANIHFDENPGEFYRIVRSRTAAPAPIDRINTDMPQDDPGVAPAAIHYRLEKIDRVIEGKTHVWWELGLDDLAHLRELFLSGSWTVSALPGWSKNPFEVFDAIPAAARARFMIENSRMIFGGFARGPICLVQAASYAVDEYFWIWFLRPEIDPTVIDPKLGLDSYAAFFSKDGNLVSGVPVLGDKYGEPIYREALEKTTRRVKPEGFGLQDVWNGDGTNPNAWLTVHRNQISVDVLNAAERPITGVPRSVWLMTYANFERMYYNAATQYKYWGTLKHQNDTFSWQTYTRTEAEDLYVSLFGDQSYREQLRDRLTSYQGKVYNKLFTDYAKGRPSASPQYKSEDELDRAFYAAVGPAIGQKDRLNHWPDDSRPSVVAPQITNLDQFEAGLRTLTNRPVAFGKFFPNVMHVRVGGSSLYTILAVRSYRNDKIDLAEGSARTRDQDYIVAIPGFAAYEAHLFVDLPLDRATGFLTELGAVTDQASWNRFADRYKVGRNSPQFWSFVDWLHHYEELTMPVRAGLLELRAYDEDETPF